jgi:hypothetical protein
MIALIHSVEDDQEHLLTIFSGSKVGLRCPFFPGQSEMRIGLQKSAIHMSQVGIFSDITNSLNVTIMDKDLLIPEQQYQVKY